MGARILRHKIVGIVGSDERHAGLLGKLNQRLSDSLLPFESMLLNFKEVISLPHDFLELMSGRGSASEVFPSQRGRGHARQT